MRITIPPTIATFLSLKEVRRHFRKVHNLAKDVEIKISYMQDLIDTMNDYEIQRPKAGLWN